MFQMFQRQLRQDFWPVITNSLIAQARLVGHELTTSDDVIYVMARAVRERLDSDTPPNRTNVEEAIREVVGWVESYDPYKGWLFAQRVAPEVQRILGSLH